MKFTVYQFEQNIDNCERKMFYEFTAYRDGTQF